MKSPIDIQAPLSETELIENASTMAGKTLEQIANLINVKVPINQKKNKGWIGQLAEKYLGATASNLAEPDFLQIGVELKTIPMAKPGIPKESTYICTVNLTDTSGISWETSVVRIKTSRILWLPVEIDNSIPFMQRRFGSALIWSPSTEQEQILKNDWEEIMELISIGELDKISSSLGSYLQVRPKAANARSLGRSYSYEGKQTTTLPRGFYLRASFTRTLFRGDFSH